MDLNSINTLISKAFYKGSKIMLGSYDADTVGVTIDGYVMWLIPEKDFIFDKDKLLRSQPPINVRRLIFEDGYEDAVRTNELIQLEKKTLVVFKSDNVEVLVDMKLLKQFDKDSTFKVKGPISGVLVYENSTLVGLVMPTRPTKNFLKRSF